MPLYEYTCPSHGNFDEFRPSSLSSAPIACPDCGEAALRVLTAPLTRVLDKGTRIGMERNEKSRHEPHVCKSSCGCGSRRKPKKTTAGGEPAKPKLQSYTGARPWVIEHA